MTSPSKGLFTFKTKAIVWSQIITLALLPLVTAFSANAASPQNNDDLPNEQMVSSLASSLSTSGASGLKNHAQSMATGAASANIEQWLSQFGTAKVALNVDSNGHWDQSAFDLLAPLYDNRKAVWFTQFGLRAPDGRITSNIGSGVRTFYVDNWMFGGNIFFDDDVSGKNRRIGFGAEAWTNYLKLSANTYVGTSQWHDSRDLDDYDEKPADGFDIQAEGYLPAWPQMGAKVIYEKYYGNNVALFDTDHLQHSPSAITLGMSYTPIPLISLETHFRQGQDAENDTQFQMNVRYDLGHDWRYQLDPENVDALRTLAGSRYDLVERNNQIIMQYKKKATQGVANLTLQTITDNSPADGLTPNTLRVLATNRNNTPVINAPVVWSTSGQAKLENTVTVTDAQGIASVNLTNTAVETVNVTAQSGASTVAQESHFSAVSISNLALKMTKDGSVADGSSADIAVATITDANNRPIANSKISWSVTAPAVVKQADTQTDANGQALIQLTATQAGTATIKANAGNLSAEQQGTFVANAASAVISTFAIVKNNSPANGITPDAALLTVTDANHNPISDTRVNISVNNDTVMLRPLKATSVSSSAQTDKNGQLRVVFTDTIAESDTLTASLDNGETKTATAQFAADAKSAQLQDLQLTQDGSLANGSMENAAQVYVTDDHGNALSGIQVNWHADKSTVHFTPSPVTDASGKTTIHFTDTIAENVTVTAQLENGNHLSVTSSFVKGQQTATIQSLVVEHDNSPADGVTQNLATVTVVDENGTPMPDQHVRWARQSGNARFTQINTTTDANGRASGTFTDTKAQMVTISATLDNSATKTVQSQFVANSATAKIASFIVHPNGSFADGKSTDIATVMVNDAYGNKIAGENITWQSSRSSVVLTPSGATDEEGKASVTMTDTVGGNATITAILDNGQTRRANASFITIAVGALTSDVTTQDANGQATIAFTATLTANGQSASARVPDSDVIFSITNGVGTLSATEATTNTSGQATVTLSSATAGSVTVNARSKANTADSGQSRSVSFNKNAISQVMINGFSFDPSAGVPTTGFPGANFQILINYDARNAANYSWSTNQSWASVDSSGTVTFSGAPGTATKTVTVSATPKNGATGDPLTYTFTVNRWFVSAGKQTADQSEPDGVCSAMGMNVPSYTEMSNSPLGGSGHNGTPGTLYGEWGSLLNYPTWTRVSNENAGWAQEQGRNSRTYMFWSNGNVYDNAGDHAMDIACSRSV
ncbi:Ig-like domain-containing protein [Citrobacter sp. Igbk 14]|uniref:Ig-like domain-containing protein n=1 Tax=Citrobacter sp. Igbk 14 TaxID=2963960 RepID=UPI0023020761|nr:inverse autotransporter beta domain-containing protein [Citrobacter sp. Igbk 14]MDA8512779.1 Ig-like domain-containing protein [Citrobacter sp. Igbk 14]